MLSDVWMVKLSENLDFPLDLFKDSLHFDLLFIENLDSYFVSCDFILGNYNKINIEKLLRTLHFPEGSSA
jgi:hypothetical protein